ncbi:hypothetical protein [Comamonas sp. JUb58]|uniref:hypothetical protein n=1 Tax=Comamonas sp. JUb58 TaxID=2485114 RepID=UPI00105BC20B|nr:hypothetical protein [Comamonas sp. JUb58]TDS74377.1 hypothetical protein EDF71_11757 [Comamonas sp. JUb58]
MSSPTTLTLNGHQLLDALNAIAPERTEKQLSDRVCLSLTPTGAAPTEGVESIHCWLADYPESGSILLHQAIPDGGKAPCDVVSIALQLIAAARWVGQHAHARNQPEARALAKAILKLTSPIIEEYAVNRGGPPGDSVLVTVPAEAGIFFSEAEILEVMAAGPSGAVHHKRRSADEIAQDTADQVHDTNAQDAQRLRAFAEAAHFNDETFQRAMGAFGGRGQHYESALDHLRAVLDSAIEATREREET